MTLGRKHRGDLGETDFCGKRVAKASREIALMAALDEVDAAVCLWSAHLREKNSDEELILALRHCHTMLTHLMSYLSGHASFGPEHLAYLDCALESQRDEQSHSFVDFSLATVSAALGNVCRTRCRTAEQLCAQLGDEAREALVFLNRLSLCFFVWARACTVPPHKEGQA